VLASLDMKVLLALGLALLPHTGFARDWELTYERATTVGLSGAVPAGVLSLAGATAATALILPEERQGERLETGANALGMTAAFASPISVIGTGMLAGGSLRARRALVEQGAEVGAWGGAASWSLLGTSIVLAQTGVATDSGGLVTAAAWTLLGAQVAGDLQLAANYRAHGDLVERTWRDRYEQGRTAYRSGLVMVGLGVGSGAVGVGLIYLYYRAVERARGGLAKVLIAICLVPVAAAGAGGCLFAVGGLTLGPGIMSSGALRSRGALVEGGEGVVPAAGWASLGLLVASAPVAISGILVESPALYVTTGALWLGAIGLAMVQMEQNRSALVALDEPQVDRRIHLPPLTVRF